MIRRHPSLSFEPLDEVIHILDAAFGGDVLDGFFAVVQNQRRPVDALAVDELCQSTAAFLVEQIGQITGIDMQLGGNGFQAQIGGEVILYDGDGLLVFPVPEGVRKPRLGAVMEDGNRHSGDQMKFSLADGVDELVFTGIVVLQCGQLQGAFAVWSPGNGMRNVSFTIAVNLEHVKESRSWRNDTPAAAASTFV